MSLRDKKMKNNEIVNSLLSNIDKNLLNFIDKQLNFVIQNKCSTKYNLTDITLNLKLMKLKYLDSTNEFELISRYLFRVSTI